MVEGSASYGRRRQRSSIACRYCHGKRVKCDASNRQPCSNCRRTGTDCLLIESKRGKHRTPVVPDQVEGRKHLREVTPSKGATSPYPSGSRHEQRSECDIEGQSDTKGPEMLYAEMLDTHAAPSSGRNLVKSGGQVVYLGETFNLTYLLEQSQPTTERWGKLHYALPIKLSKTCVAGGRSIDKLSLDLLERQSAFDLPPKSTCGSLFETYFECVQPHYPVLDRDTFMDQYSNLSQPPSWLLLQAVLFMAAGHCDERVIADCGFDSRTDARLTLFKRTKALYDQDYEPDKVTTTQALFLMSFWWATPMDQKDTWHWLGNAISLALTIGMHRSTKSSGMSIRDQRLWKRIWWSLFIEDKHAAAALGRPAHVRLGACDVEPLGLEDFEEDGGGVSGQPTGSGRLHALYVIQLSNLSVIVERIIENSGKSPGVPLLQRDESLELCERMLQEWEAKLPVELQLPIAFETSHLWTNMLHVAYHWFKILTHRTRTSGDEAMPKRDVSSQAAMESASKMSRIIEVVLTTGRIMHCPIHVVPSLFAAMSMHANSIRSRDIVARDLAFLKVRICMIALREVQTSWPVGGWVLLLFTKIAHGLRTDHDLQMSADMRTSGDDILASKDVSDGLGPCVQDLPSTTLDQVESSAPDILHTRPNALIQESRTPFPIDLSTDWSGFSLNDIWMLPGFGVESPDPMGESSSLPMSNAFPG